MVVFQPPHEQCRFRAYESLSDGAQKWMGNHLSRIKSHPEYLQKLNAGDCAAVAHILAVTHYYTSDETKYAHGMAQEFAKLA